MVTLREFSAWVTCDGVTLMEYETRPDHYNRSATCWIPSEAGKVFTVHWRDHGSQIPSAAYISLDGTQVPGRYIWGQGIAFRSSVRSGPASERPFLFSKYEDNGNKGVPPKREDEVGTIILRIKQIQRGLPRPANKYQVLPGQLPSEFAFTTGGVCATFGREVQGYEQWPQTWTSAPWDGSNTHSYVKFIFRYRPMQFLIAQGIAPRISPVRTKAVANDAPRPDAIPNGVMSSATSTPSKGKSKANDTGVDNDTSPSVKTDLPQEHQNSFQSSQSQFPMPGMGSDSNMSGGVALPYGQPTGPSSYYREHTAPTRVQYPSQQQQLQQRNVSGSSVVSTNSATSTMSGSSTTTDASANSASTTRVSNIDSTSTPLYAVDDNQTQMSQDELHASMSLDASSASLFGDFMDLDHHFDTAFLSQDSNFGHV